MSAKIYTEVEVDLSDFSTSDLIAELRERSEVLAHAFTPPDLKDIADLMDSGLIDDARDELQKIINPKHVTKRERQAERYRQFLAARREAA